MIFFRSRINRLAALISVYVIVIILVLFKGFEMISDAIITIETKPEIVKIPERVIQYQEVEAEITEEKLLEQYMTYRTDENMKEWFVGYKALVSNFENPPATIYDIYTEEEINYLLWMVQTEIGSADFISKVRIADVVWNRMDSSQFPNTLKSIITAPYQFAYSNHNVNETTRLAVEYSFMFPDITKGAVAFHSGTPTKVFFGRPNLNLGDPWHSFY